MDKAFVERSHRRVNEVVEPHLGPSGTPLHGFVSDSPKRCARIISANSPIRKREDSLQSTLGSGSS
jgi:hypothetical protein